MKPLGDDEWLAVALQLDWLAECIRDAVQDESSRSTNAMMRAWTDDRDARALIAAAQALARKKAA